MAISDGKVEQTPSIDILILQDTFGDRIGHLVDLRNCALHGLSQDGRVKAGFGASTGILTESLQGIEKEGKCPFAVGAALDAQVPLVSQTLAEATLDVLPSTESSVVHPHQTAVCERVAVVLAQGTLGRGTDMAKD